MARAETGAVMSRGMALMSGGNASGRIAKPAIYVSGLIASGTPGSVCVPTAVCARFKIERPAPAAADSWVMSPASHRQRRAYPVKVRVGNVRNNDAALLDEISLAA